ncbi:hypothetical protein LAZ67_X001560, partial [Cordylochernes scorpioides]
MIIMVGRVYSGPSRSEVILVRAKRPRIQELFQAEATRLEAQIQKLAPPAAAAPRPTICSVSKILTYGKLYTTIKIHIILEQFIVTSRKL